MRKSKFLTPAGVLGIIGGSFTILTAIVILVQFTAPSIISYFLSLFIVAIMIFLIGVYTIISCSLCLYYNKKKTYTHKGKNACLISLIANGLILLFNFIETSLYFSATNHHTILFDLLVAIILNILALIFYIIGFVQSVPGSPEEIQDVLTRRVAPINYPVVQPLVNNERPVVDSPIAPKDDASNSIELLEKLFDLRQKGVISEEEYESKKKDLLSKI